MIPSQLLEAEIELLSPAIVVSRVTRSGYVRSLDCIPGSTLRGALITALYRLGYIEERQLRQEAEEPSILASPAYPIAQLSEAGRVTLRRTLPATPATFKCKVCGSSFLNLREISVQLTSSSSIRLPVECPEHGPAKPLYSLPVYVHDGDVRVFRPRMIHATSVAINKPLGTAMRGMLFSYEAIAEGTRFWARLALPDSIAGKIPEKLEVAVGRGSSRGSGRSVVRIRSKVGTEGRNPASTVFVVLSPLTPLSELTYRGCRVRVGRVLGRVSRVLGGWDVALGKRRPVVELVRPGAIVEARIDCSNLEEAKTFAALVSHGGIPVKLFDTWLTGVNVLIPVEEYERLLGETLG